MWIFCSDHHTMYQFMHFKYFHLIPIKLALVNIFVSAFSGPIKVNKTAIFPLKFLHVAIMRPAVLREE